MAKKPATKATVVAWKGFVKCELNSERKRQFKETWKGGTGLDDFISECMAPGYKLSFSVDTYHDCMQVSWYCGAAGDQNAGWCLTARGGDHHTAMAVLMFKHHVLLEGDWSSAAPMDEEGDYLG